MANFDDLIKSARLPEDSPAEPASAEQETEPQPDASSKTTTTGKAARTSAKTSKE